MKWIILLMIVMLVAACTPTQEETVSTPSQSPPEQQTEQEIAPPQDTVEQNEESELETGSSTELVPTVGAGYQPFDQATYNQARAEGKTVILNFYATWCPKCNAERPVINQAFSDVGPDVVGFEVNYRDNEVTDAEEDLAREFGITAQGTKIILRPNQESQKQLGHWSQNQWETTLGEFAQ